MKPVHERGQSGIRLPGDDAAGCIQPLVGVRVREEPTLAPAFLLAGRNTEIGDASAGLQLCPLVEDGVGRVNLDAGGPEWVIQGNLCR